MGLREVHAAQTRELILDAAFSLFIERGYDKTTMEDIAAKAEVGTTTLYRYYPSKDLLVVGPLQINGQMADEMRSRPEGEPLDVALGNAVRALLVSPRAGIDRVAQIQIVLESTPTLQTRILEQYVAERTLLVAAIADRLGRSPDDLYCRAAARMATMVLELVGENGALSEVGDSEATAALAVENLKMVMQQLDSNPPPIPRL
jgi:AcrR family transcriptional regulator